MTIEEALDTFIKNDAEAVFLLRGAWGVGKTTAVNNWIAQQGFDDKNKNGSRRKVIWLSLFGINDVNQLNSSLLSQSSLLGKVGSVLRRLNMTLGGSHYANAGFSLAGLFDYLAELEAKKESRHGRKPAHYLIVLDDIERKDVALRLDQIFGFVDQLNKKRTKVIMITNSEAIIPEDGFRAFKEKVVDRDFLLEKQDESLKKEIFKNHDLFDALDLSKVDNLRTLIRFRKIVESLGLPKSVISNIRYQAIIYALESQENNKYSYSDLKQKWLRACMLVRPSEDLEKAENEFDRDHQQLSPALVFAEHFDSLAPFNAIEQPKNFLSDIYSLVSASKYDSLRDVPLNFKSSPFPPLKLQQDIQRFRDSDIEYMLGILHSIEAAQAKEFSEISLFFEMCQFDFFLSECGVTDETILRKSKDLFRAILSFVAERTIDAQYYIGNEFRGLGFGYNWNRLGNKKTEYLNLYQEAVFRKVLAILPQLAFWDNSGFERLSSIMRGFDRSYRDAPEWKAAIDLLIANSLTALKSDETYRPNIETAFYFLVKETSFGPYLSDEIGKVLAKGGSVGNILQKIAASIGMSVGVSS